MIPDHGVKAFRDTLLAGGYNLLLGAGISLDSHNGKGEALRSAETLRKDLCSLTGARDNTSLTRAYALLSKQQIQEQIVGRFKECKAGTSLQELPQLLWRRLFTFNVDDVLENVYRGTHKQTLVPLNCEFPASVREG
jgi:hypothetical protein